MIEVTVIVGLPGSGKTHLAKSLMDHDTTLLDDISQNFSELSGFLQNPTAKLIITDPHLCIVSRKSAVDKIQTWLGEHQTCVQFISFENNPEAAWANICRRDDDRTVSKQFVYRLSKFYQAGQYDQDYPVYQPAVGDRHGS